MKEKVVNVKNLKEKTFDIEKMKRYFSDTILALEGAYKIENDHFVLTSNDDADIFVYLDMETGKKIKILKKYNDIFAKNVHFLSLSSAAKKEKDNKNEEDTEKEKVRQLEIKKRIARFSSNR